MTQEKFEELQRLQSRISTLDEVLTKLDNFINSETQTGALLITAVLLPDYDDTLAQLEVGDKVILNFDPMADPALTVDLGKEILTKGMIMKNPIMLEVIAGLKIQLDELKSEFAKA